MGESSKDEINRLRSKLKKANSNHEEMVAMWAQQGAEVQQEFEETKLALENTLQELQTVKKQLRKHEQKNDDALIESLRNQMNKNETNYQMKLEEMATDISSMKDQLRHTLSTKDGLNENLIKAKNQIENDQKKISNFEIELKEKNLLISELTLKYQKNETDLIYEIELKKQSQHQNSLYQNDIKLLQEKLDISSNKTSEFELLLEGLKTTVCELEENLRNAQGKLVDERMEFKISVRRSGQQNKELRDQLRKEAKARQVAEAASCRLERSLMLQAEAMLEQQFLHDGRSDSPFQAAPSPDLNTVATSGQNHDPQSVKREVMWRTWAANLPSPLQPATPISGLTTTKNDSTMLGTITVEKDGGEGGDKAGDKLVVKSGKERNLCQELGKRLETLLAENATVRARVSFLEEEVIDLTNDIEDKRTLVRQLLKHPISAKIDMDKKAVEDRVKSLVSAVSTIGSTNPFLTESTNISQKVSSSSSSSSSTSSSSSLSPFSFTLTPQESLLQITLRENIQLRQKLASLEPDEKIEITDPSTPSKEVHDEGSEQKETRSPAGLGFSETPFAKDMLNLFTKIKDKAADVATGI